MLSDGVELAQLVSSHHTEGGGETAKQLNASATTKSAKPPANSDGEFLTDRYELAEGDHQHVAHTDDDSHPEAFSRQDDQVGLGYRLLALVKITIIT